MNFNFFCIKENSGLEGLYQGDILLNKQQEEALKSSSKTRAVVNQLWPGGVVPYDLSPELGKMNYGKLSNIFFNFVIFYASLNK